MSVRPKTVFLTGGTGFVGGHIAEAAESRGLKVRALARKSSDTELLRRLGAEIIVGDLEDASALASGVHGADWVINAAAKVGDWGAIEDFRRLNVAALKLLLDAAVKANVERFVHVSSLGVYEGRDHYGTDETAPTAPHALDGYTRSKIEAEELAIDYFKKQGLPITIVRPGFIYGPRDRTVLPKLTSAIKKGAFAYFGSGEQALNCIYVKNLVHAVFLAAESPAAPGEIFNITDGERVSKRRFVSRVAQGIGLKPPQRRIPLWLARFLAEVLERRAIRKGATEPPLVNKARYKFLGLNLDYSIEKARRVLGYKPPYTTDQGLDETFVDWNTRESAPSINRSIPFKEQDHDFEPPRQAHRGVGREVLRRPRALVPRAQASRRGLYGRDRRAEGGRDLCFEARLPGQGGSLDRRRQGL